MRTILKTFAAAVGAAAALSGPRAAFAQVDVNPPLPNVLLLIDTSGSMENMVDGQRPEAAGAACTPGTPMPAAKMNRWASLVSVLTGSIDGFSCQAVDRASSGFLSEYTWSGAAPYDAKYYLPFHRLLSNGCTPGPGSMPSQWDAWPAGGIKYHPYDSPAAACAAPGWQQQTDGILDTFRDRVRFSLMTFDTLTDAGTGAAGATTNPSTGVKGMWSYFPGWQGGGSPAGGNPPSCALQTIEVGARNPSAPPWEGRLIPFGLPNASLTDVRQTNDHVQEALIAMRPYGATPLAGMLSDARYYLLNDTTHGSANDPYYQGGCRKTFIILLSDGEPNLDLRPDCESGDGKCPFDRPYAIAHDLATYAEPNRRATTYAVGFGLSSAAGTDCKALTQLDLTDPVGKCKNATGALAACCTLGRIAYEGGTSNAYYADDIGSLKSVLSQVLSSITAGSTSRTLPVFASAVASTSGGAFAAGYQFLSSFDVPLGGSLWTGNLERKRYVCEDKGGAGGYKAYLQDIDESKGDRFDVNVNKEDPTRPRVFFTVIGDKQPNGDISSRATLRRNPAPSDGLGSYKGTQTGGGALLTGPAFATALRSSPEALEIKPGSPPSDCSARLKTADAATCAERILRWEIGESNPADVQKTRQKSAACPECSELGSLYHATPVAVGAPSAYLRDPSYAVFAAQAAKRPLVLYAATTDGQLHAFKVAPNDPADPFKVDALANNELWSFIPPHVLPRILPTYDQQAFLLDGTPVVRDVILERTEAQAISGGGQGGAVWSTVLVAGGGSGGGFYYALDITDPTKPKFLWQLATNGASPPAPLFGKATPTPAIATVAIQENGGVKEVAVAILPGGSASQKAGACSRKSTSFPHLKPKGSFAPRSSVRCWGEPGSPAGEVGPARSLTIVRLDNGEVLMSFRGADSDGPAGLGARAKVVDFDSPIMGVPVPYPAEIGSVADRVYVGDSDGTLWRVNLTSMNPQSWSVELAWDAYSFSGDTAAMGEPIQTPPVVSTDAVGNTVVLFSTGDQDMFTSSTVETRVWSLTEQAIGSTFIRTDNWVIPMRDGKRVTGPISLFDSTVYFATYTPPASGAAACSYGYGSVWGVDYTRTWQEDPTQDPALPPGAINPYPQAKYTCKTGEAGCAFSPGNAISGVQYTRDQPPGTTVFGVAVTQTPSCAETTTQSEAYYGPQAAFSRTSQGEFQLVYQTGKVGASSEGAKTNTMTERLPSPKQLIRIDSWASVVE